MGSIYRPKYTDRHGQEREAYVDQMNDVTALEIQRACKAQALHDSKP